MSEITEEAAAESNTIQLLPDPVAFGEAWRARVEAEYAQVERVREWRSQDHYAPIAQQFADDPFRTDDDILNYLRSLAGPDDSWLDIGAGGGRFALPLALHSPGGDVIAVEPSGGMRAVMQSGVEQYGVRNLRIVEARFPEDADPATLSADFSLAAHVGYDLRDINGFVDAQERCTRRLCAAVLMDRAPSGGFVSLWGEVHGEARHTLPGMREYLTLLLARGATPEVRIFPRDVKAHDEAHIRADARRRLWLNEGSEKDQHLQRLLDDLLPRGFRRFELPQMLAIISWKPVRGGGVHGV